MKHDVATGCGANEGRFVQYIAGDDLHTRRQLVAGD